MGETNIPCEVCGHVPGQGDDLRILALPKSTRHVWEHAGTLFHAGKPVSIQQIAEACYLDRTTVYYHLPRLVGSGLVTVIPKREGSRYKRYVKAEIHAA